MKKNKTKEIHENRDLTDAEIHAEIARHEDCQEYLNEVMELVKDMPNISFEDLITWLDENQIKLSLALRLLTCDGTLIKGRFGYFHKNVFCKSKN